jgi:Reverse transcriptase (RNA-dependent DNA polymerase)
VTVPDKIPTREGTNGAARRHGGSDIIRFNISSVNDVAVAASLDSVSVDDLVRLRFFTSTRELRSRPLLQLWRTLVEFATGQFADALQERREAISERYGGVPGGHVGAGGNDFRVQCSARSVIRAYKFMHLLAPLAFAAQSAGPSVLGTAARLHAIVSGAFSELLGSVLAVARGAPTGTGRPRGATTSGQPERRDDNVMPERPGSCSPTRLDEPWTVDDTRKQRGCAILSGRRNGIRQAASRLEQQEGCTPAVEATLTLLLAKHPAAGTRGGVTDAAHEDVRALVSSARERVGLLAPSMRTFLRHRDADIAGASGAGSGETVTALRLESEPLPPASDQMSTPLCVSALDLLGALRAASAGKSAGLDGLRYEHLWMAAGTSVMSTGTDNGEPDVVPGSEPPFLQHLERAYAVLLTTPEVVPEEVLRLLRGAALTAVGVKGRPIACSSVWRRLLASASARAVRSDLSTTMEHHAQFGFGVPSGVEHVATEARLWHEIGGTIVQLDSENAFNTICRTAIAKGLERFCPRLLPLFEALYCGQQPPELRYEVTQATGSAGGRVHVLHSHLGCQQGDPLGPLWFAVGATHLLYPLGPHAPPPPHCAFLDDINLRLPPGLGEHSLAAVQRVVERLARGGLRIRPDKSLAVAPLGATFSLEERQRLQMLNIPFVDGDTIPCRRGFVAVGVPVGDPTYVAGILRERLFDDKLWRLAWQLVGMARDDFHAAFRIFRGSLSKRFGYLARNVDPGVGAPWFGGFDGFCAWVLDRLLHLRNGATAADMRRHLDVACGSADADSAASSGPLVLPGLQPPGFAVDTLPGLPLRVARLPPREGGMGLPQLHRVCVGAYVSQLLTTLRARVLAIQPALRRDECESHDADAMDVEGGPLCASRSITPFFSALRSGLRHWTAMAKEGLHHSADVGHVSADFPASLLKHVPLQLLQWAHLDAASIDCALQAIAATATSNIVDTPTPTNENLCAGQHAAAGCERSACTGRSQGDGPGGRWRCDDDDGSEGESDADAERTTTSRPEGGCAVKDGTFSRRSKSASTPQRAFVSCLLKRQWRSLQDDLHKVGPKGKVILAQLRSQRAPGALSWQSAPPGPGAMGTIASVTMTLLTLCVDAWGIQGDTCPFGCGSGLCGGPSTMHAVACHRQHLRGNNVTHVVQKRCLQRLLRGNYVPWVENEHSACFTVPGFRIDTAIMPGAMSMAPSSDLRTKGILLDTSVRAPTADSYVKPRLGSAAVDGHAAFIGEKDKVATYDRHFDHRRWHLVPFVQESFGRFGPQARWFLKQWAAHAAACAGGSEAVMRKRRGVIHDRLLCTLSGSLIMELSERVLAYVRGAVMAGRSTRPVSTLLSYTS